jgi:adenylosuccinate synthase
LDTFDEVKVCTGYRINGELIHGYPDRSDVLGQVVADYITLPGWKTELRHCRSVNDLPAEARAFITAVERESGIPIRIIGVGPERDDVLDWTSASIFGGTA